MKYNFKKETETAKMPTRHTSFASGVDFYSDEHLELGPGETGAISTGISWNPEFETVAMEGFPNIGTREFPKCNISLFIKARSGHAFGKSLEASNAGVIDQDYVSIPGKPAIIHIKLYNMSKKYIVINQGDKIAQGVPLLIPYFSDVEDLDTTRNGEGFGSSDKKG